MLTADGDLEDKLSDAMDDEWPMVALKLASWADVDALADYQYMLRKPLCLICDDAELLEAGLRAYQGRALYEGNLTKDALAPLVEKIRSAGVKREKERDGNEHFRPVLYSKARHAAAPPVLTMRKYAFDVRRYIAQ